MEEGAEAERREEPQGLTAEEVERLRGENVQLRAEVARLIAAFERVLRQLVEVHATLLRVSETVRGLSEDEQLRQVAEGFRLMAQNVLKALESEGVRVIESVGKPFDPELHEAVGYVETDEAEEGTVVAEIERGFTFNDVVLRPSKVLVARRPRVSQETGLEP
ncbi:MAG: nucleotide exchange factor GrpE [Aigarchaeota archaeon]|nr:nucleotide exchange factor GrpE [Aigarchaeota archaeon]MDW8043830.1 nucleotide exchange factor GrpE [Nitrososphaerota archaeon]